MALTKITGTGLETLSDGVTITTADNTDTLTLISTDADPNTGPNFRMYRNSGSPANNDILGVIQFEGRNDNAQDVIYGEIGAQALDVGDGSEDTNYFLNTIVAGTLRNRINLLPTEVVLNEESLDSDFRVESNGNANMLFVDGGNNRVGIGTASAASILAAATNEANFVARFINAGDNANRLGIFVLAGTNDGSGTAVFFAAYTGGGAETGQLRSVDGTFQLTDTSDRRLKQDIVDTAVNGITSVNAIKVRDFAYKTNPTVTIKAGFIAQELQEVFSPSVSYSESDSDKILSVSRERLVPVLVKAIQELSAKNDALEARITALE